jgi:predicted phage-related endonuclease
MRTLNVEQGTPEWHAARAEYLFTASGAPAMMGDSPHKSREALLRELATGEKEEISAHTQRIFDKGHDVEELARPIASRVLFNGQSLPNTVGVSLVAEGLTLLASFDGLSAGNEVWEHKQWNEKKAHKMLHEDTLLPEYMWQLEHQMLVAGSTISWFQMSDGTEENCYFKLYMSDPAKRAELIAGWLQFKADLSEWRPTASLDVVPATMAELPKLHMVATGQITQSNINEVAAAVKHIIDTRLQKPNTDEEFAQVEAFTKAAAKAAKAAKDKRTELLSIYPEIATLDDMVNALDTARLHDQKLVRTRKDAIRYSMIDVARSEWEAHKIKCEAEIGTTLCITTPDFSEAIKGKKNFDSMQDAINTKVAREKVTLTQLKDQALENAENLPDGLSVDDVRDFLDLGKENFGARCVVLLQQREAQAKQLAEAKAKAEALTKEQPKPKKPKADPLVQELMDLIASTEGAVMNEIAASVVATFILGRSKQAA